MSLVNTIAQVVIALFAVIAVGLTVYKMLRNIETRLNSFRILVNLAAISVFAVALIISWFFSEAVSAAWPVFLAFTSCFMFYGLYLISPAEKTLIEQRSEIINLIIVSCVTFNMMS